ncbi:putative sulfonate biosynthesis enzyme [Hypoxylon fragiforme]|uniref:putative sulfonate biosynthesis enzyme n=1 Tax=Hypoxylon fragiforme TaxID=63214 RepID=UPI0020C5BD9D|nr:putative sulfonate biosynthesis enzyme [Hypoxylon fragiforme]KAI2604217.1 putative sulfonate biosynthesis enzyme [Hypoxylon fragiforme]
MATPLRSFTATGLLRRARLHRPIILNDPPIVPSRPFTASAGLSSSSSSATKALLEDRDSGFGFVRHNPAPRSSALALPRYLSDVVETMGPHIDGLKLAGGSFSLFPEAPLRQLIDLAHTHGVYVSTGGWMEHVLAGSGGDIGGAVDKLPGQLSTGFLSLPADDWARLAERVQRAGLTPKPELGIQFGAGGDTSAAELRGTGTSDPGKVVNMAKRFVREVGVERVMIESEGITENVQAWRTGVIQSILRELPLDNVHIYTSVSRPDATRYIPEFGVDVNLFVDHSQIVQLAGLRAGIWGKSDIFGKVTTVRP